MIELNSATVVLLFEILAVLLIILLYLLFSARKNKIKTFSFAEHLVDNLDTTKADHAQKLSSIITDHVPIAPEVLDTLLNDIEIHEKALYRLVIQIMLDNNPELLGQLQENIANLATPYCKMLQKSFEVNQLNLKPTLVNEADNADNGELALAQQEIARLTLENSRLHQELLQSVQAAENIVEEYSRVFNGRQEETELHNSALRMLDIFKRITINTEKIENN